MDLANRHAFTVREASSVHAIHAWHTSDMHLRGHMAYDVDSGLGSFAIGSRLRAGLRVGLRVGVRAGVRPG